MLHGINRTKMDLSQENETHKFLQFGKNQQKEDNKGSSLNCKAFKSYLRTLPTWKSD
jgi:hypothetical protein